MYLRGLKEMYKCKKRIVKTQLTHKIGAATLL